MVESPDRLGGELDRFAGNRAGGGASSSERDDDRLRGSYPELDVLCVVGGAWELDLFLPSVRPREVGVDFMDIPGG